METIRVVRRKKNKGSGILWVLLVIVILGAVAWWVIDQDIIDREGLAVNRDSVLIDENDAYKNRYRNPDDPQENSQSREVDAFVSFVNREIIPEDSIENQTKQIALNLFQKALNEVEEDENSERYNDAVNRVDSVPGTDTGENRGSGLRNQTGKDSAEILRNEENPQLVNESLIDAGRQLVDIQKQEYPSFSKMGDQLTETLDEMENAGQEKPEDMKNFFISSSSLLQEIDSERSFNRISYNKKRR